MDKQYVAKLVNLVAGVHNKILDKSSGAIVAERVALAHRVFNTDLLPLLQETQSLATEYVKKRDVKNEELKTYRDNYQSILSKMAERMTKFLGKEVKSRSASSFDARIHLLGESDLDFAVMVENFDPNKDLWPIANCLGVLQLEYQETRNKHDRTHLHYVFSKMIGDVEIEVKVRDKRGFELALPCHEYLEGLTEEKKVILTYGKYLLKVVAKDKIAYNAIKMIAYYAGQHGQESPILLEPLK